MMHLYLHSVSAVCVVHFSQGAILKTFRRTSFTYCVADSTVAVGASHSAILLSLRENEVPQVNLGPPEPAQKWNAKKQIAQ
eukprot:4203256-Amphidinium_carterae.1